MLYITHKFKMRLYLILFPQFNILWKRNVKFLVSMLQKLCATSFKFKSRNAFVRKQKKVNLRCLIHISNCLSYLFKQICHWYCLKNLIELGNELDKIKNYFRLLSIILTRFNQSNFRLIIDCIIEIGINFSFLDCIVL